MKRISFLAALLLLLTITACKKDKPDPDTTPAETLTGKDYFFKLKVGNYWVYKTENHDDPNVPPYTRYDTVRVVSDSVINGNHTYYITSACLGVRTGDYTDSAAVIIDSYDNPFKYLPHQGDTINIDDNTYVSTITYTGKRDTVLSTNAGSFHCFEDLIDGYYMNQPPPPPTTNPRTLYTYYGKNIGLVKYVYWYAFSPATFTSELYSYHIEP